MRPILLALPVLAASVGALALGLPPPGGSDWSEADLALVRSLALEALPAVPPDPSNRVADDPRAVRLGQAMFFDPRFSATREVDDRSSPKARSAVTGSSMTASASSAGNVRARDSRIGQRLGGHGLDHPHPGQRRGLRLHPSSYQG